MIQPIPCSAHLFKSLSFPPKSHAVTPMGFFTSILQKSVIRLAISAPIHLFEAFDSHNRRVIQKACPVIPAIYGNTFRRKPGHIPSGFPKSGCYSRLSLKIVMERLPRKRKAMRILLFPFACSPQPLLVRFKDKMKFHPKSTSIPLNISRLQIWLTGWRLDVNMPSKLINSHIWISSQRDPWIFAIAGITWVRWFFLHSQWKWSIESERF